MRKPLLLAGAVAAAILTVPVTAKLSKDAKAAHALDRLTFGPRTGDVERVASMGLKKWLDQQLHPDRIAENPALEAKLKPLDTLRMSTSEVMETYPPPQLLQRMANGTLPLPSDPDKRRIAERLVEQYKNRINGTNNGNNNPPRDARAEIAKLLTPEQMRTLRNGTDGQRREVLESLPEEKRGELMAIAPGDARRVLLETMSPEQRRRLVEMRQPAQLIVQDLLEAKLYRAVYSNRQLAEVLSDFWFNHFNVFLDKGADRYMVTSYERDAIRPHVLGKFKDMVLATAHHPAMLFYLDNWQSMGPQPGPARGPRRGLNENYGRELMELHTLGVDGGYTQKDVTEVARCFTGWTIREPQRTAEFFFNERMHDKGEKTVLGVKIPAGGGKEDGLKVIDILVHHPSTARYISKRLAVRFVSDNPPPKLIDRMAKTFTATEGDLRAVLKTMFDSKEFWDEKYYRAKVKTPLEMVASSVRALNADVIYASSLAEFITQLGQPLYRKQEPTGYSNSSEEWINSASLIGRMNFAMALVENRVPGVKVEAAAFPGLRVVSKETKASVEKATPVQSAGLQIGSPDFQRR